MRADWLVSSRSRMPSPGPALSDIGVILFSKRIVLVAFAILGLAALAGCGSSSKKSDSSTTTTPAQADKAPFCADNAKNNAALTGSTPSEYVQSLKDNSSAIDNFEKNAPAEIKTDAQTLVAAARKSIQD